MKSRQRQLIKQYLDPLVSQWKLIVGCLLIAVTVGLIFYLCMPEVYKCESLLDYEYQQIDSGRIIQEQENQRLQDTVSTLSNNVVNRNNLEEIIEQFDLYPESRSRLPIEDVVDLMRKQIRITSSVHGVAISFKGGSRDKVMNVTNTLASKFIEENFKHSESLRNNRRSAEHNFLVPQSLHLSSEGHPEHKQKGYTFKVMDSAHFPNKLYRPDLLIIMMVSVGAGLGVGVSLAYALGFFDTSLKDAVEVERYLELPVVCSVSYLEYHDEVDKKRPVGLHYGDWDERLTMASAVIGPVSESFRTLRTRILHPMAGPSPKTLLVTSATSGEGKSFVCANLGISFCRGVDNPGILVDADLRKPSLARLFGHPNDPGLVDYLRDEQDLGSLMISAGMGKLHIIPAGLPPVNPVELLGSESMAELVAELSSRYDNSIVIFDAPSLDAGAETFMLAKHVDAVILVVRWGTRRREHIKSLVDQIGKEKIAGVVFNAYKSTIVESMLFGSYKYQ